MVGGKSDSLIRKVQEKHMALRLQTMCLCTLKKVKLIENKFTPKRLPQLNKI